MLKCANPNCLADNPESNKFCFKCGEPLPQKRFCEKCGKEIMAGHVFCGACGIKVGSEAKKIEEGSGISMGDKNVIAGDVIREKREYKASTMTVIENRDDTKTTHKCIVCSKYFQKIEGHECPECHEFACAAHFSVEKNICFSCIKKRETKIVGEYKEILIDVLKDNKIDANEAEMLRKERQRLGISEKLGTDILENIKKSMRNLGEEFSRLEKMSFERAKELMVTQYDVEGARREFGNLFEKHPDNEDVIKLHLLIQSEIDPQKTKEFISQLSFDCFDAFLVQAEILCREKEFKEADRVLEKAKNIFGADNCEINLKEIELLIDLYIEEKNDNYLKEAQANFEKKLAEINAGIEQNSIENKSDLIAQTRFLEAYFNYAKGNINALQNGETDSVNNGLSPFYFKRKKNIYKKITDVGDSYLFGDNRKSFLGIAPIPNYKGAQEWYKRAAELGDIYGQYRVGYCFRHSNPEAVKAYDCDCQDLQAALEWFEKAASRGHAESQEELALMYHSGIGVEQNYKKALKWHKMAADQGIASAQGNVGLLYQFGNGESQNFQKAREWYLKAANQGHAWSQHQVGLLYFNGNGVDRDYQEAMKWFIKAADQGYADSQINVGYLFQKGYGVECSYDKAREWYQKAADQGNVASQFHLGVLYKDGLGVEKDLLESIRWFKKALDNGYKEAETEIDNILKNAEKCDAILQNSLGILFYNGDGVEQDYLKGKEWYEKAASQDNIDSQYSMFNLGTLYEDGLGVEKDLIKAREWYKKASDKGNDAAKEKLAKLNDEGSCVSEGKEQKESSAETLNADHQFEMGNRYEVGKDVEKNEVRAAECYKQAADGGHVEAQVKLARMYQFGRGVNADAKKAFELFMNAAKSGNDTAQFGLGLSYLKGIGTERNDSEAFAWFQKAAMQNNALGQYNVGKLYLEGKGVPKNASQALSWMKKAAANNNVLAFTEMAKMYLDGVGVEENITEAKRLFQVAAERGEPNSQYWMGVFNDDADKHPEKQKTAIKWFLKSAENGSADAQNRMGMKYYKGDGVPKNDNEAFKWFTLAAKNGHASAQSNLAFSYINGEGCERNYPEALRWFHLAAENGSEEALEFFPAFLNKEKKYIKLIYGLIKISKIAFPISELIINPDIPSKKEINAKEKSKMPVFETLLALIDLTTSDSAKACVAFGTKGIYYKNSLFRDNIPAEGFISYQKLPSLSISFTRYENKVLTFGNEYFIDMRMPLSGTPTDKKSKIIEMFNNIANIIKENS